MALTCYQRMRLGEQEGNDWPFRICGDFIEWYSLRELKWINPEIRQKNREGHTSGFTPGNARGYTRMGWKNSRGSMTYMDIHRIVWISHFGPIPKGLEIDHIDMNKSNNSIKNLRIVTHAQNLAYAREQLGNWIPGKLKPHQVALALALNRHSCAMKFLAERWGVHVVTLNNLRAKAKKNGDPRYLAGV